jgi:hypothetical protein
MTERYGYDILKAPAALAVAEQYPKTKRLFERPMPSRVAMICDELKEELWRLEHIGDDQWHMIYLGWPKIEPPRELVFSGAEMPEWVKNRLAVLRMLDIGFDNSKVGGVGARIRADEYWVVKTESD